MAECDELRQIDEVMVPGWNERCG